MQENYTKKAASGAALVVVLSFAGSGLGYLLRLILARSLTPHEFGMVYAVIALFGLIYIFQHLGLNEALTWWIAQHSPQKHLAKIKSAVYIVVGFQVITALALSILLILCGDWISQSYIGDPASYALIVIHCAFLVLLPLETAFQSIFQGLHRMALYTSVNLARITIVILITIGLLSKGFGVPSVFWAYVVAGFIPIFVWIPLMERFLPGFWSSKYSIDKKTAGQLFSFGLPVIFTSVAHMVMAYTDTLVLTGAGMLDDVGFYNAAAPTASLLWVFAASIAIVTFPMTTELWQKKKIAQIKTGIEVLYKYAVIAIVPLALTFIAYPDLILGILFGPEYTKGAQVLQILATGGVIYTIARVNDAVLSGMGKPKVSSKIAAAGALVNLGGNLILVPSMGMVGAAISTVAGFVVMFSWGLWIIRDVIKFDLPIRAWIVTAISAGAFLGVLSVLKDTFQINPIIEAMMCVILASGAYLLCLFIGRAVTIEEVTHITSRIWR